MDNIENPANNVLDSYCKSRGGEVQNLTTESICSSRHVNKFKKIDKKSRSPHTSHVVNITTTVATASTKKWKVPVVTSTKQSISYVTVKGIESETSYLKRDWPLFILKELSDNAYDFYKCYSKN